MNDTDRFESLLESEDKRPEVQLLFNNLKQSLPELKQLLNKCNDEYPYEDVVYRYYHGSFKVYWYQNETLEMVAALQALQPDCELNAAFQRIVAGGTGKVFEKAHNRQWDAVTRPILEAFFHAKFFLEMAVKYGQQLDYPPNLLPSGWAALLYLYNLR